MPQIFVIDISKLLVRPKVFKSVGFDWWHDYNSNPRKVELAVSMDG